MLAVSKMQYRKELGLHLLEFNKQMKEEKAVLILNRLYRSKFKIHVLTNQNRVNIQI